MTDVENVIKGLEDVPNIFVNGYCYLQMPHEARNEAVSLIKEQKEQIERLKDRIEAMKYEGVD